MRRRIITLAFYSLCILFTPLTTEAHTNTFIKKLEGSDLSVNKKIKVEDNWYNYMQTSFDWCDQSPLSVVDYEKRFTNIRSVGKVSLQYNGTENLFYGYNWQLAVEYVVVARNSKGQIIYTGTDKIFVNYDNEAPSFIDAAIKAYPNAHHLEITITDIYDENDQGNDTSLDANDLPDDFVLESSIEVERYFMLDTEQVPETNQNIDVTNGTVEFLWEYLEGAEEYELQFVHVSDELGSGLVNDYKDYNNATRVFVTEQSYKTHLAYETGTLYYRVRGVGRHGMDFKDRLMGAWSEEGTVVISDSGGDIQPFENTRNWTYQITHAEFGKRAEVVTYFDGSGQSRQNITLDNTTNVPVVAESFMDYEGRPAVSILPSPVVGSTGNLLEYYSAFTQITSGDFDKRSFDENANRNAPPGLANTTGTAGNFYSPNNPLVLIAGTLENTGMNHNIADAGGYSYTRLIYDDQGRVKEQSGVGVDHKVGSGHTTKYYYGGVTQEKLDRLFGAEVGYASHYRKKMVQDPNGQLSVSYENLSGQVIATAFVGYSPVLAGTSTELVDQLVDPIGQEDITENFIGQTTEDLSVHNQYNESENEWNIAYSMLVSSVNQDYNFNYSIDLGSSQAGPYCNNNYGCKYDLELKIVDPDGNTMPFTANISDSSPSADYTVDHDDFPITVEYPLDYDIVFSVNVTQVGNYRVEKKLSLKDVEITFADYLAYISDPDNDPCDLYDPVNPCSNGPDYEDLTNQNPLDGDADCNSMYEIFKDDLSPGGQYYFNLTIGKTIPDYDWLTHSPRNVPNPSNYYSSLETTLDNLGEGPVTIQTELEFWDAITDHFQYPEIEAFLHNPVNPTDPEDIPGSGLELWKYHPEYPHWVWCNDTYNAASSNNDFSNSVLNYDAATDLDSWRSDIISHNCPYSPYPEIGPNLPTFPVYTIVDDDPYFASAMGDRPVNAPGNSNNLTVTGRQLMNLFICNFPVAENEFVNMWDKAEENAQKLIDVSYTGAPPTPSPTNQEIWNEFSKLYIAQKERIIKLQKKNPCDNINYTPYLFDESNQNIPADFVADCPRQQDLYLWGSQPYNLGDPYNSEELHDIYDWFDSNCSAAEQTSLSIQGLKDILNWWGTSSYSPCSDNSSTENLQLTVMDNRAFGFQIRIPDIEQNIMDVTDNTNPNPNGDSGGVLDDNDLISDLEDNLNLSNPCEVGTGFYVFYPTGIYEEEISTNVFVPIALTATQIITGNFPANVVESAEHDHFRLLTNVLYFCDGSEDCWFSATSTQISNTPSCPLQSGTGYDFDDGPFYSFEEFYLANPDYFDCLVDAVNGYTAVNYTAEHKYGAFVIYPDVPVAEKSVLSSSDECINCNGDPGCVLYLTSTCIPIHNPCDLTIPHCLCENYYNAVAIANDNDGNNDNELLLYLEEYDVPNDGIDLENLGANTTSLDIVFMDELEDQCAIIYDEAASDDDVTEAIAVIENMVIELEADAATAGHCGKVGIDCNDPYDPAEEEGNIIEFNNLIEFYANVHQEYLQFQSGYVSTCMDPITPPDLLTVNYNDLEYDFTLYYYSADGNLFATVPPEGVVVIDEAELANISNVRDGNTNPDNSPGSLPVFRRNSGGYDNWLMTIYNYDSFNSVVESTVPDHDDGSYNDYGTTKYLYDDLGRIRFSRNPKQEAENTISYTKYDDLGRIVESGEMGWSSATDPDLTNLEANVNDMSFPDESTYVLEEYVRTQYDSPLPSGLPSDINQSDDYLRNRVVSTQYFELEGELSHATHYDYNIRGDVVTAWQEDPTILDPKGKVKRMDYEFGLVDGLVYAMHYQHGKRDALSHFYCYDANGRLLQTFTSYDDQYFRDEDSRLFYRYDGILGREELGEYKVQGMDYAYTIHGWIKGVNSTNLTILDISDDGDIAAAGGNLERLHRWIARDAFGYSLHYYGSDHEPIKGIPVNARFYSELPHSNGEFTGFGAPPDAPVASMYNGNIAAMQTAISDLDGGGLIEHFVKGYRYDQKMRIKNAYTRKANSLSGNSWSGVANTDAFYSEYSYDKNGNLLNLKRNNESGSIIDNLTYVYEENVIDLAYSYLIKRHNRLRAVQDAVTGSDGLPSGQPINNYSYDRIGNLIGDVSEEIAEVKWLVTGKVKEVIHETSSDKDDVEYRYDSQGNRIEKIRKLRDAGTGLRPENEWISTLYVRSPQGDVIATYERTYGQHGSFGNGYYRLENEDLPTVDDSKSLQYQLDYDDDLVLIAPPGQAIAFVPDPNIPVVSLGSSGAYYGEQIKLKELHLYGNRRLGYKSETKTLNLTFFTASISNGKFSNKAVSHLASITPMYKYQHRMLGLKYYEQSNHLGNVLTVVTDRKVAVEGASGQVGYYVADVVKATDYYPFGMEMGGSRSLSTDAYRYGFNGKENDRDEWGNQLIQDYGFRLYNPAIGKFLSVDPIAADFPWYTPYQFAGNQPIWAIDLDGLEDIVAIWPKGEDEFAALINPDWITVQENTDEYYRVTVGDRTGYFTKSRLFEVSYDNERMTKALLTQMPVEIGKEFFEYSVRRSINEDGVLVVGVSLGGALSFIAAGEIGAVLTYEAITEELVDEAKDQLIEILFPDIDVPGLSYASFFDLKKFLKGKKWEKEYIKNLEDSGVDVVGSQVRLVPKNGKGNIKGNRTDADALERNADGTYTIHESKLSRNSGYSTGQRRSKKHTEKGGGIFEVRSFFGFGKKKVNRGDEIKVSDYKTGYKYDDE